VATRPADSECAPPWSGPELGGDLRICFCRTTDNVNTPAANKHTGHARLSQIPTVRRSVCAILFAGPRAPFIIASGSVAYRRNNPGNKASVYEAALSICTSTFQPHYLLVSLSIIFYSSQSFCSFMSLFSCINTRFGEGSPGTLRPNRVVVKA
jgi:hypothetical protein